MLYCFVADDASRYLSLLPLRIEDATNLAIMLPRPLSPRVDRQMGRFTVHPQPTEGITFGTLVKCIIRAKAKQQIKADLNFFGVNCATLFPDLDGLSAFMNWFYQTYNKADDDEGSPSKSANLPNGIVKKQGPRKTVTKRPAKRKSAKN